MEQLVHRDETVDDLQNGFSIIQKKHSFRYGVDAVLLADFADIKYRHSVIDLGTGTGIIPILIYSRCVFRRHPDNDTGIIRTAYRNYPDTVSELSGHRIGIIRTPCRANKLSATLKV